MAVPDIFKGLESIGKWQSYEYGCRWELTNDEIERALAKIDIERNFHAIYGGLITALAGVGGAGVGGIVAGSITASVLALYEIMKARIKSVNEGNGVIVEFALKNSNSNNFFLKYVEYELNRGFHVVNLQISNIKPR
jgi:hypothetical protein